MGWTLSRYFFMRYMAIAAGLFLAVSALVMIVNFTELSSRAANIEGFTSTAVLGVAAMRVPAVMQQAIPFIALFAAMSLLVTLNRRYELVVARSVGLSAWQFLRPACTGAFLIGLLTILALNPLAAAGLAKADQIEAYFRSGQSNAISAAGAPWIKQTTADGETIIGAHAILQNGTEMVDASFFEFDASGTMVARLDARRAYLRDGYWELRTVERQRGSDPLERLEQVEIPTDLKPEFVEERLADPESIPFLALPKKIEVARSFGLQANAFSMQFNSLLALPPLLVAMTLIAATVSMRFARMGQSLTMILGGIVAGFLLYVVSVLVKAFGTAGFVPASVAAWFPVVVATFFGVTYLLYKEDG